MSQQGPNPVDAYQGAVRQLLSKLAAVTANQHNSSTPCSEWNVQALVNHTIAVQHFANSVLTGAAADPSAMGDVARPLPSEGAETALKAITDTTLATLRSIDLAATVETPFGAMPGGQFIMVPITDMIVHSWDLAKATSQNTTLDSGLAELGYNVLVPIAPMGRQNGAFGPEVSVPETASFQDRMLGVSGRQP